MTIESKPVAVRAPIFGALSVAFPFICWFLYYLLLWVLPNFLLSFALAMLIMQLGPYFGVFLAGGAWIRHERYLLLRWIGMLINLANMWYLHTHPIFRSFG
jgi:hypothetical protein